jgi:hypothetical protein
MTVEDLTPAEKAALSALAANQQPDGCWCGVEGHPVCVVCADAARELVAAVEPIIAAERDQLQAQVDAYHRSAEEHKAKYDRKHEALLAAQRGRDRYMKLAQQWRQAALEGVVRDIEGEDEDA